MNKGLRKYTLLAIMAVAANLMGQNKMSLEKFLDVLSDRYQINVAIDPVLLNQYQIDPNTLNDKNVVSSLEKIFEDSGLDYYYLDHNQILLRKALPAETKEKPVVSGRVVDALTGLPLEFAAVYTPDFGYGTVSDASGHFSLPAGEKPLDSIECSFLGYQKIRLGIGESNGQTIRLYPLQLTFDRITVIATGQHYVSGMKSEYDAAYQNYTYASMPGQDLHRSIQKLSGITKSDKASTGIRGYGSDKTLTMIDNIPVLNTGHYYNIISGVNELYFDEFTLFKNQYPSSYGNALGGMIQFSSADRGNAKIKTTSNLLYSGAVIDLAPSKRLTLKAGGRVSYLGINENGILADNFNQLRYETNDNNPTGIVGNLPTADFYDVNAKVRYAITDKSYVEVNGLISNDNTQLDWQNNRQFFIQNQNVILTQKFSNFRRNHNQGFSLKYNASLGKNITLSSDVYSYRYLDSFNLINENTDFFNGMENKVYISYQHTQKVNLSGWRTSLQFQPGMYSTIKTGVDLASINLEINTRENTGHPLVLNQSALQPAFFAEYLFKKQRWTFTGGIRLIKPSGFDEMYLQPQLSVSFRPLDGLELKSSIAKRVQNFNQFDFETRFAQNLRYYYISQKDFLPLQQSTSYMLGTRWSQAGLMLDMEAWWNHSQGSQLFTTLNTGNRGGPPMPLVYRFFTGETTTRGIDLTAAYTGGNVKYSLAYTLSKATQQFEGIYRNLLIPSPDDRRHQLTVGADYKMKAWTFNSSFTYLSGTPYLSFDKSRDKGTKDKSLRQDIIAYLPPYVSLDAGINYTLQLREAQVSLGASVSNLTNHTNIKFLQQTGEFDDKKNMQPLVTGNQSLMLGRFFNVHISTRF